MRTRGPVRGFSLMELIITMGILSVFLASLFAFFRSQVFAYRTEETRMRLKEQVDVALDFLVKELRMAGSRPNDPPFDPVAGTGGYPPAGCAVPAGTTQVVFGCGDTSIGEPASFERLTLATATSVTLQYDFRGATLSDDPDGCPDDGGDEVIAYAYDAANERLLRNNVVLLENVPAGGFQLGYFDEQGNPLAPPLDEAARASVWRVEVSLAVDSPADPFLPDGVQQARTDATILLRNPPC